jgi:hypothetical protein
MGYDLHITRALSWSETAGSEITLEEWHAYVQSDPEIQADESNDPKVDFLFIVHPEEAMPLWWSEGQVFTKNPDDAMVRKLVQVAGRLAAKVQGDDGELYGR